MRTLLKFFLSKVFCAGWEPFTPALQQKRAFASLVFHSNISQHKQSFCYASAAANILMKGSNKTGCPFLFISFSWQLFRVFTPQFKPSLLQSLPTALQDLLVLSHYNLIDCTVRTSQQTSQFHLVCRNFVFSKANSQFYPYLILNWKEYFTSDVFLLNQIYLAKPLSLSLL